MDIDTDYQANSLKMCPKSLLSCKALCPDNGQSLKATCANAIG